MICSRLRSLNFSNLLHFLLCDWFFCLISGFPEKPTGKIVGIFYSFFCHFLSQRKDTRRQNIEKWSPTSRRCCCSICLLLTWSFLHIERERRNKRVAIENPSVYGERSVRSTVVAMATPTLRRWRAEGVKSETNSVAIAIAALRTTMRIIKSNATSVGSSVLPSDVDDDSISRRRRRRRRHSFSNGILQIPTPFSTSTSCNDETILKSMNVPFY